MSLTRLVRQTRAPFSNYIRAAFQVTEWTQPESTAGLFPLPLPYPGAWQEGPRGRRSRRAARWSQTGRIDVSMLALALTHVHDHCARWLHQLALRRCPNEHQRGIFARLGAFVSLRGRGAVEFDMRHGRKPESLDSELSHLEFFLTSLLV